MHGHWLKGYLRDGKEIEGGGGGSGGDSGVMVVTLSGDNLQADKTFGEIATALDAGKLVTVVGYPIEDSGGATASRITYFGSVANLPGSGCLAMLIPYGADPEQSLNENATLSDYPIFADDGK